MYNVFIEFVQHSRPLVLNLNHADERCNSSTPRYCFEVYCCIAKFLKTLQKSQIKCSLFCGRGQPGGHYMISCTLDFILCGSCSLRNGFNCFLFGLTRSFQKSSTIFFTVQKKLYMQTRGACRNFQPHSESLKKCIGQSFIAELSMARTNSLFV